MLFTRTQHEQNYGELASSRLQWIMYTAKMTLASMVGKYEIQAKITLARMVGKYQIQTKMTLASMVGKYQIQTKMTLASMVGMYEIQAKMTLTSMVGKYQIEANIYRSRTVRATSGLNGTRAARAKLYRGGRGW